MTVPGRAVFLSYASQDAGDLLLKSLRGNPRFDAMLRKLNL